MALSKVTAAVKFPLKSATEASAASLPPKTVKAVVVTFPLKIASPPTPVVPTLIASTAIVDPILLAKVMVSGARRLVASVTKIVVSSAAFALSIVPDTV